MNPIFPENKTGHCRDLSHDCFCDFGHFLAKKMAFFSKTDVMINFFAKKLAVD
jgi:hypothetical protein